MEWVESISGGRFDTLPASLEAFFKMRVRRIAETYFETWFCQLCPDDRVSASERLRRKANLHLLSKSQEHFMNPHAEVLQFVSGMTPFLL